MVVFHCVAPFRALAPALALPPVLALVLSATPLPAQNITGDDLTLSGDITQNGFGLNFFGASNNIFDGRACIGPACDGTEPPEQGPLRLKWSEPDILFQDSSTSGGLSSNDWRLVINDSTVTKFAVQDIDGGTMPFTIEGGVPDNTLYLASNGNVGLGTIFPQEELHLVGPSFPAIRLDQDTSGGNPAASWRIQGNHNEFSIINDFASFSIEAGGPTNAMRIKNSGDLGLGVTAPSASLHVQRTDGSAGLLVENTAASPSAVREMFAMRNNGGSYFTLDNTQSGTTWFFVHENAAPNRFIITDGVADGPEMTVSAEGDLEIQGQLFTAGSCAAGCDRVFDADYPLPTIPEQAAMMLEKKHLPNVGPTPEDGPFNITQMTGGMLNELEKAHLYIALLEERLRTQEADADRQDRLLADQATLTALLAQRLTALEARN